MWSSERAPCVLTGAGLFLGQSSALKTKLGNAGIKNSSKPDGSCVILYHVMLYYIVARVILYYVVQEKQDRRVQTSYWICLIYVTAEWPQSPCRQIFTTPSISLFHRTHQFIFPLDAIEFQKFMFIFTSGLNYRRIENFW